MTGGLALGNAPLVLAGNDEREPWLQTNTEFHQDWTADHNKGDHLRWKQGLDVEGSGRKRYKAVYAPRRRRRWILWIALLAMLAVSVAMLDRAQLDALASEIASFARGLAKQI